jgi:hypothetical protein
MPPIPRLPLRAVFKPVSDVENANLTYFRQHHFQPNLPCVFPTGHFTSSIPAITQWFEPIKTWKRSNSALQVNETYLDDEKCHNAKVTVEVTQVEDEGLGNEGKTFERTVLPLTLFIQWMQAKLKRENQIETTRLYVAQHSVADLPPTLQADLPAPEYVRIAGKGDIYSSSVWMGVPPTHTPLHRDPNPNLFVQLAGAKVIRMLAPDHGRKILEMAKAMARSNPAGDMEWDGGWMGRGGGKIGSMGMNVRGEEMMVGEEGRLTEDVVWGGVQEKIVGNSFMGLEDKVEDAEEIEGVETRLGPGDGLFIPKGWWHSIKGVGDGVNASVSIFG